MKVSASRGGTGRAMASAARSPKPSVAPVAGFSTTWTPTRTAFAPTPQRAAAASASIWRTEAPIWRMVWIWWRIEREPSVS